jgi:diaminohydroxyphosphoribosylaminopyrimidine deaminase/5-amino-6-(5-phosphoribosylamino)uracil reductase
VSFSSLDHRFMAVAMQLARKGLNTTDPNPRVGCVIADGDRIVGQGWHEQAGGQHAEIAAINDAAEPVRGMTAYVTLEPCAFHGKTPPCTDALLEAGIGRVVAAIEDPHPQVNGGGLQRLRDAGVQTESGLLAAQAEELNAGFLKRMRSGRPWVRIKSAVSLDGRTGLANGESKWITSEESRRDVQRWRARSSAILTGIGTVLADDPLMNARTGGAVKQPLRVVADSRWRTPLDSRILAQPETAWVAGGEPAEASRKLKQAGVNCLAIAGSDGRPDLGALMDAMGGAGINEVQVEAGPVLCGALLEQELVDEILLYVAPVLLGDSPRGPFALGPLESMAGRTHLEWLEIIQIGADLRHRLKPRYKQDNGH